MSQGAVVVATIQSPTPALKAMTERARTAGMSVVVAGDTKTPADFVRLDGAEFLSLDDWLAFEFALARSLPRGHCARKNIGYLHAIAGGAFAIFETDDDNLPREVRIPVIVSGDSDDGERAPGGRWWRHQRVGRRAA
jgi:hypothetical protein